MKKILLSVSVLAIIFLLQSFTTTSSSTKTSIDIKSSKIIWKGYKVAGSHEGTVNLQAGTLSFKKDRLVGGEFEIDMTSLTCTDLVGEYKEKLDGHLKSDDFFGVDSHPVAILKLNKVKPTGKNSYTIQGDLTLKGITKTIDFTASIYGKKATANLKIDRTAFNIRYGSGNFFSDLKDNLIYDEFDLVIDLAF